MTTNDAAERLRDAIWEMKNAKPFTMDQLLDAALAAERRAGFTDGYRKALAEWAPNELSAKDRAILDTEAER